MRITMTLGSMAATAFTSARSHGYLCEMSDAKVAAFFMRRGIEEAVAKGEIPGQQALAIAPPVRNALIRRHKKRKAKK